MPDDVITSFEKTLAWEIVLWQGQAATDTVLLLCLYNTADWGAVLRILGNTQYGNHDRVCLEETL